ncbi:hypothetical protein G9A89_007885 [Geosiphon pyriformis]|nr:hypothetical protein G9A89_007885 [Geosiphon pyriformis]
MPKLSLTQRPTALCPIENKLSFILTSLNCLLRPAAQSCPYDRPMDATSKHFYDFNGFHGKYRLTINEPTNNQVYKSKEKKITFDYTFDDRPPNEIFLLDIYLYDANKQKKLKTFIENTDTEPGKHRFSSSGTEYSLTSKKVVFIYKFEQPLPSQVLSLDIYLLDSNFATIKIFIKSAPSSPGFQRIMRKLPNGLQNGAYYVRYNEV